MASPRRSAAVRGTLLLAVAVALGVFGIAVLTGRIGANTNAAEAVAKVALGIAVVCLLFGCVALVIAAGTQQE